MEPTRFGPSSGTFLTGGKWGIMEYIILGLYGDYMVVSENGEDPI